MYDFHVHSIFSADCRYSVEKMARSAITKKIKLMYIADHYELNDRLEEDMTFDLAQYKKEIQRVNKKMPGLEVLTGIELAGDLSQLERFDQVVKETPLDMVILATHKVKGLYLSNEKFYSEKQALDLYEAYYSEILTRIKGYDNFDVVGHLDLIDKFKDRYYVPLEFSKYKHLVMEILLELIQRGKALEINTSGYHTILNRPYPKLEILTLYKKLGGERIIIGSDAHHPDYIGYKHKQIIAELKKIGYSHIAIYRKRIPHLVRL